MDNAPAASRPVSDAVAEYMQKNSVGTVFTNPPRGPHNGPDCIWDNGPTTRQGSCWVCGICGETTGCG
jgi:hypothetical protein